MYIYIASNRDKHTIEEEKQGTEEEADKFCTHEREIDDNARELVDDGKGILMLSFDSNYCILYIFFLYYSLRKSEEK